MIRRDRNSICGSLLFSSCIRVLVKKIVVEFFEPFENNMFSRYLIPLKWYIIYERQVLRTFIIKGNSHPLHFINLNYKISFPDAGKDERENHLLGDFGPNSWQKAFWIKIRRRPFFARISQNPFWIQKYPRRPVKTSWFTVSRTEIARLCPDNQTKNNTNGESHRQQHITTVPSDRQAVCIGSSGFLPRPYANRHTL